MNVRRIAAKIPKNIQHIHGQSRFSFEPVNAKLSGRCIR